MTDQEDIINLCKVVFDDNNQERKSWACLGQTCCRSLIVFLSQLFVILLIIFGCFWRIHLSKTCDKSTVWVGILRSAAGYILPSPRLWTSFFYKNLRLFIIGRSLRDGKITAYLQLAQKWNLSANIWQNLLFYLRHFMMLCKKRLKTSSLFKV